ncbi:CDP-alcohol phosphatidyltransferase family protein [Ramlibacter sp. H39-3-26]|uniref:CDP-alcohol phosphatidyltransferase family protein n=1 Tax=Curvibacter soli TaxID=3031331 RepID=UPI0023DBFA91|nr:CDP-alcohol phosphatidyltransferase family protein [Ramlibacter sp. H39-3-26]MDF1483843.1 CDP-alcohol phosphatidyltransferase family protein [Ramlibacter sp. H39-3-26]
MSANAGSTQRVAGIIVGESTLSVWGLTSQARLGRQFERAGVVSAPADADRVIVLRADWVYDEALVRGLAGATDDVALRAGNGEVVALSVPSARAAEAATLLAERRTLADARTVSPAQIADGYNDKLRKREPPYLLPLTAGSMDAIEWRTFLGAYKGVTDLVTLYVWPRPARYVTRLCAEAGITPNQVTLASLALVLVAMWLFWTGHYALGLAAAWGMTFLDTVDGKLARVTLQSSRFGDVFDHSIDLIHPPFWWWAWIVGLPAVGLSLTHATLTLTAIIAGYVLQRLEEGLFIACFGIEMHVWERFDSRLRLITARRNPNLLLLTASMLFGRPDLGILAVAIWTVACLVVHAVRLLQAAAARRRGPLRSWLSAPP